MTQFYPMITNLLSKNIFIIALFLSFPAGCSDDIVTEKHATYQEAVKAELFGRGWLPDILPASTTQITVSNDLDLNISEGEFYLDHTYFEVFTAQLQPYSMPQSPFRNYRTKVSTMRTKGYGVFQYTNTLSIWVFFCEQKTGYCCYDMWLNR